MITNENYLLTAGKIAAAFCGTNDICKNSTYERIKTNLDDTSFGVLLSNLNRGSFIIVRIISMRPNISGKIQVSWSWLDVIRGTSGTYDKAVPLNQIANWNQFGISVLGMNFIKDLKDILNQTVLVYHNLNSPGYGIALTTDPTNENGTTSSNDDGGGLIVPVKGSGNNSSNLINTTSPGVYSGSNYSSYLIPAAAVLGIYLLMNR